jgi:hypothetical protein
MPPTTHAAVNAIPMTPPLPIDSPERPAVADERPERRVAGVDPRTLVALVAVGAFGAMFAIGAGIGWGARAGLSVLTGAAVAVANLYGLARILGALVGARSESQATSGIWGILALVKVFVLFGGVWLLMSADLVDPLPLVVGWGALPIGIALGSILSDKTARSHAKEAPPPPVD